MICIVNYGLGNLASIYNMLRRLGFAAMITDKPEEIARADKLILPGVGAYDEGMRGLRRHGFIELLDELVHERRLPVLGICLGMQLLGTGSEEGSEAGLGWLQMRFKRFPTGNDRRLKRLHMGWNVTNCREAAPLLGGYDRQPRFYFVHGYYAVCDNPSDIIATTNYGVEFPSVVGHQNIYGAQFHPEKSHRYGMHLLRNFAEGI